MNWQRLREHLIANGSMTARGSTRTAKARRCNGCNALVIIGLDDDIAALDVTADADPITVVGEVLALAQGRRTFSMRPAGSRWHLDYRDHWRIRTHPPMHDRPVLAEHRCHQPMPAASLAADTTRPTADQLPPGSPAPF